MTIAHHQPTVAAPDVETVLAAVRARGLRVSAARRVVVEALFAADGPVSAAEIAAGLGGRLPPLDQASVYANLDTLEQLGIVSHVHVGHAPGRYSLADRVERDFVGCEACGRLEALEPSALAEVRATVRAVTGFHARFTHFPLIGLCDACARERGLEA